jgi:hypothetical protein
MLLVAGVIEAFVSPTEISAPMKFAFAGAIFTVFVAYLSGLTVKRTATAGSAALSPDRH